MLATVQRVTYQPSEIRLPLVIVQEGADALVDPSGAQMSYDRGGSRGKPLEIYEGFYFEVLNGPEREQVLGGIGAWFKAHLVIGVGVFASFDFHEGDHPGYRHFDNQKEEKFPCYRE